MRRVTLDGTDLTVSRLSFGTGRLHRCPTSRGRQDLLATAFEYGFTHFDTSPYYGFGIGEEELGRSLESRKGRATVATKIGLYPPTGTRHNTASVWTRKILRNILPSLSRPLIDWSIASASSSLDTSLHRLGVDHVDLLLLHEPDAKLISSDEFLNWLMAQQAKGKVRAWGLAGEAARIVPWLSCDHRLAMVLQVRDSVDRKEADLLTTWGRNPQITYGYCSAACIHQQKIGPAEVLELAMRRNATGSILMSSLNVGHVRELAVLAETFDGSDN